MFGEKISDKRSLIVALADALNAATEEFEAFVDLTDQTANIFIPSTISGMPNSHLNGHELVWIAKVSSHEGFEIMRDFAERCEGEARAKLVRALSGRRPFRAFKDALAYVGLSDNYYSLRDEAYRELAESRLQEAGIDFIDGKIVCSDSRNVEVYECEDDSEEEI